MARRFIDSGGAALAGAVAVGTALYVAGAAPPFPWNAWGFHAALLLALAYALCFGRSRRGS